MNADCLESSDSLRNCTLKPGLLKSRQDAVINHALSYHLLILNDQVHGTVKSGAMNNLRIAAGLVPGEFYGRPFQDSDVYKWLEAVSYSLVVRPDDQLKQQAISVVDLIAQAQQRDGYIYTPKTISKDKSARYSNLCDDHELYCAGHLIEACSSFYAATRYEKSLQIATKLANHLVTTFGAGENQIHGYPGHPEIELALIRLFRITGKTEYLRLTEFFLSERGASPNYFIKEAMARGEQEPYGPWHGKYDYSYNQSHIPFPHQHKAAGHAVRAIYLYRALTDFVSASHDAQLFAQAKDLWNDVVQTKMYITGGVGSSHHGESITASYDLPNESAYAETCASVALALWAQSMFNYDHNSEYIDVMERAIYNTVFASMSFDGTKYFYVNPLELHPNMIEGHRERHRLFANRQPWFASSCCPTNVARLLTQINQYLYYEDTEDIYVNHYTANTATLANGAFHIDVSTEYPLNGEIFIRIHAENVKKRVWLRIPAWCRNYCLKLNDQEINLERKNGYICLGDNWNTAQISLNLELIPTAYYAPLIPDCAGKVAYMVGPLVYCAEEYDNGAALQELILNDDVKLGETEQYSFGVFRPVTVSGIRIHGCQLYCRETSCSSTSVRLIPYYLWNYRGSGEMAVWLGKRV